VKAVTRATRQRAAAKRNAAIIAGIYKECSQPRCDKPVYRRDLCRKHYRRFRMYGDPAKILKMPPGMRREAIERFWSQIVIGPTVPDAVDDAPCWLWNGQLVRNGYGYTQLEGRRVYVHRLAWELLRAPIPDELKLDHVCHNKDTGCHARGRCPHRRCCNPAHLDPVTVKENNARMHGRRTHCVNGHEYTPANTYRHPDGSRACRICKRETWRRWKERSRSTAALKEAS
jgi:hypothetical protein